MACKFPALASILALSLPAGALAAPGAEGAVGPLDPGMRFRIPG
jgi:hypothetical protein